MGEKNATLAQGHAGLTLPGAGTGSALPALAKGSLETAFAIIFAGNLFQRQEYNPP